MASRNTQKRLDGYSELEDSHTLVQKPRKKRRKRDKIKILSSKLLNPSKLEDHIPRVKRRIAFLIVQGKKDSYIKRQLGCTQKTLEFYYNHPEVQEAVAEIEQSIYTSAERENQYLFVDSVKRIRSIIRKGDPENALKAIDMVWRSHGRLVTGKQGQDITINNQNNQANLIETRDDAHAIMEALRQQRRQQKQQELIDVSPQTGVEE